MDTELKLQRIRQVAARADNLAESIDFYRDVLGARFLAQYDPPGLGFFDFGGVRLLLERNASNATLYFQVDDIDAACASLESRGVSFDEPPHMIFKDEQGTFGPPGEEEWMAFFSDPAGNILALAGRK